MGSRVQFGAEPATAGVRHVRLGRPDGLPHTGPGLVDEARHQAVAQVDQGGVGFGEVLRITAIEKR